MRLGDRPSFVAVRNAPNARQMAPTQTDFAREKRLARQSLFLYAGYVGCNALVDVLALLRFDASIPNWVHIVITLTLHSVAVISISCYLRQNTHATAIRRLAITTHRHASGLTNASLPV
jgi:hypothetical protein